MHADDTTPPTDDRKGLLGAILVAGVVALALVVVMITRTSEAVFTASVENTGNSFHGGTVTLGDNNDLGAALFELPAMDPGETYSSCINVEYTGSITSPSAVKVYSGPAPTGSGVDGVLDDYIELTVERGTSDAADFGDCGTSFTVQDTPYAATSLTTFYTTKIDYDSGAGTWTPTSTPETRTYRISAHLLSTVPDTEEGARIDGVTFVWEVQS